MLCVEAVCWIDSFSNYISFIDFTGGLAYFVPSVSACGFDPNWKRFLVGRKRNSNVSLPQRGSGIVATWGGGGGSMFGTRPQPSYPHRCNWTEFPGGRTHFYPHTPLPPLSLSPSLLPTFIPCRHCLSSILGGRNTPTDKKISILT